MDFATIPQHIEFITRLIVDICGGQAGPLDDQIVNLPKREPVRMRLARCHRVLGVPVTQAGVAKIFGSLGLEFTLDGDDFIVTPPSYRFDLVIEEDLIEEVARIYGFENIPTVPPMARAKMFSQPEVRRGPHALRRLAAAQDYQEVVNYSFVEAEWERDYAGNDTPVKLVNPIASHLSVMRSSLIACSRATTPPRTVRCKWPACASRSSWRAPPGARRWKSSGACPRARSISTT